MDSSISSPNLKRGASDDDKSKPKRARGGTSKKPTEPDGSENDHPDTVPDLQRLAAKSLSLPIRCLVNAPEERRGRRVVESHVNDFINIFDKITNTSSNGIILCGLSPPVPGSVSVDEFVSQIEDGQHMIEIIDGNHRLCALRTLCDDPESVWNTDDRVEVNMYQRGSDFQAMKFAKKKTRQDGICRVPTVFDDCRTVRTIKLQIAGFKPEEYKTAEVPNDQTFIRAANKRIAGVTEFTIGQLRKPYLFLVQCAGFPLALWKQFDQLMTTIEDGGIPAGELPRGKGGCSTLGSGRATSTEYAMQIFRDLRQRLGNDDDRSKAMELMLKEKQFKTAIQTVLGKKSKVTREPSTAVDPEKNSVKPNPLQPDPLNQRNLSVPENAATHVELLELKKKLADLDVLRVERDAAQTELAAMTKKLADVDLLRVERDAAQTELAAMTKKLADVDLLRVERDAAQTELAAMTKKLADVELLRVERDAAQTELAAMTKKLADVDLLRVERDAAQTELAAMTKKLADVELLQVERDAAQTELAAMTKKLADVDLLRVERDAAQTELAELKRELTDLHVVLKLKEDSVAQLRMTLGDSAARAEFLQKEMESLRKDKALSELDRQTFRDKGFSPHNRVFVDKSLNVYHGGACSGPPFSMTTEFYGVLNRNKTEYDLLEDTRRVSTLEVFLIPKQFWNYSKKQLTFSFDEPMILDLFN